MSSKVAALPAIVALGEPMIEFNQARADTPDAYVLGYGGDTSNMAIAAARLAADTAKVGYITRVGDDAFGRMLTELWRREGVDTHGVAMDATAATGVYFVTHGPHGHEFSYLRAGSAASRMVPADLPHDVIGGASILHVSGISQAISADACDTVFAAIAAAGARGARVSYDPNLRTKLWPVARARAVIMATIGQCDWFLPSFDEVRMLSGYDEPGAIIDWCHALGAPIVALKRGKDGVVVSDGRRTETIAGHRVESVDATGAGDCFDGAFAVRMHAGDSPFEAVRYANAAAALATIGYGAVGPLPRDSAVRALLAASVTQDSAAGVR